ncbi:hypothetical protein NKS28_01425 [Bacillus sp. 1663tsa1]|uniref:hypothetical protein n=1 Tax=Bacillus sp. 1663tsa1 TaxID=2953804 RepID=UPI00209F449C|nr:hypothetical protein [Bacillus sp. 1663tsa1]MCP1176188.1 hypothetical protein [Bacillus sp. 1663tsa1]
MSFLDEHGIGRKTTNDTDLVFDKIGNIPISNERLVAPLDSENILAIASTENVFIYNLRTLEQSIPTGNIINYKNDISSLYYVLDLGNVILLVTYGKFVIYDKKTLNKIKIIDHKTSFDGLIQESYIIKKDEEALLIGNGISNTVGMIFNLKTLEVSSQITFEFKLPPFMNDFIEGDLLYCCDRKIRVYNYRTGKLVKSAEVVPQSTPLYTLCGLGRIDNYICIVYYGVRENGNYYIQIRSKDTLERKFEYIREMIWNTDPTVVRFANEKRFVILNEKYTEIKLKRKRGKEKFFLRTEMDAGSDMRKMMRTLGNESIGVLLSGSTLLIYKITKE